MTTFRHVLVNKSHRFWIFPLKQKQKQKSPNYILHCFLNRFKHMLTSQKPGSSPFSVPICPILPTVNPPQPCRGRQGPTNRVFEAACPRRLQPPPQSWGLRRLEPRATPFPGTGAHRLRAVQAPGQGKHEWDHSRRQELPVCLLSHPPPSPHPASFFFLGWAHSPIAPWYPTRKALSQYTREGARRNHLSSKSATHLLRKCRVH